MTDPAVIAAQAVEQLDRMILRDVDRNPTGLRLDDEITALRAWASKKQVTTRLNELVLTGTLTRDTYRSKDGQVTTYKRKAVA